MLECPEWSYWQVPEVHEVPAAQLSRPELICAISQAAPELMTPLMVSEYAPELPPELNPSTKMKYRPEARLVTVKSDCSPEPPSSLQATSVVAEHSAARM